MGLKQSLKVQVTWKSHPNAQQVPTLVTLTCISQLWPPEKLPMITWQRKGRWTWFTDDSPWCASNTWKCTNAALQLISGTSPREVLTGSLPSEIWTVYLVIYCLERDMARCVIGYEFMVCGQWFGWIVRDLEWTWLINWWWRNLGNRYVNRPFWMRKNVKVFVFPVNYLCKGDLRKNNFDNQVNRMTCWMNINHFLPQPFLSSSNGLMNKMTMVAGIKVYMGSAT